MKINRLPAPTWRWMKVNESDIELPANASGAKPECICPEGVRLSTAQSQKSDLPGGLGEEFNAWISENIKETTVISVDSGVKPDSPAYMDYSAEKDGDRVSKNLFELAPASSLEVIQFIDPKTDNGTLIISNRYEIKKCASLKLIQIISPAGGCRIINDNGGICDEEASFELVQLVIGSDLTVMGDHCRLGGTKSRYGCDIAYHLKDADRLDMNYIADHTGKKSLSDINISGVLSDESSKIFRGTIDFHKGCAQSKGNELEEVLIMNEGVSNKTVPLILCDEEDVEGNHGASIGKPDENLLLYLSSRGLDEEEIYRMMARARIDSVIRKIQDKKALDRISVILGDDSTDE